MKVRVYVSKWTFEDRGTRFVVNNPIVDYLMTVTDPNVTTWIIWPDRDLNITGAPNISNPNVMTFVKAPDNFNFQPISQIPNNKLLPSVRPNTPTANIPQAAKNNMQADLDEMGIPFTMEDTWGNTLRSVARGINSTVSIDRQLQETDFE